jgi:hypothetical protein
MERNTPLDDDFRKGEPVMLTSNINMHTLAFQGLTLSLMQHGKNYIALQNQVDDLPDERRRQIHTVRTKRFTGKLKKQALVRESHEDYAHHSHDLVTKLNEELDTLDDVRRRFSQQINDSNASGYTELAIHYAQRLLYLETKGMHALAHLHNAQEGVVETKSLVALIQGISSIRDAIQKQLEWIPQLTTLVTHSSVQYRTIFQPAI